MNACEKTRPDLKAYADGELSILRRSAVRAHLSRCATCRMEIDEVNRVSKRIAESDAAVMDAGLRARILDAVPIPEAPANGSAKRRPLGVRSAWILTGATVAIVAWFIIAPQLRDDAGSPTVTFRSKGQADYGSPQAAMRQSPIAEQAVKTRRQNNTSSVGTLSASLGSAGPALPGLRADGITRRALAAPMAEREVHREATVTVQVDRPEARGDEIEAYVKGAGGYVANSQINIGEDNVKTASFSLRVPIAGFDAAMARICQLGEVTAKNVNGEDLTEQIAEQHAARDTLEGEMRELRQQMQGHRGKAYTADAAALRELKVQYSEAQARLEISRKLAALATISVELREKPKPAAPQTGGFVDDMKETGESAERAFMYAIRLPIELLVWLLVYSPVWLLLLIGYRKLVRA